MLFNSFEFLIFLPIVFAIHWFFCRTGRSKNIFLIAASYVFYGWWNIRLLLLIFMVTAAAYIGGLYIDSERATKATRKIVLVSIIILNIATLVVFKYYDFFAERFVMILNSVGFSADIPTLGLILPVGISFYTFQAMGYVIDVYRGGAATRDAPAFFLFICFFPQLVAGPIERASNILPQFLRDKRAFSYKRGVSGMRLILWGLFKKMVIADNAAIAVNSIFNDWTSAGTLNLWIGALLFSFQIYGDFSGYSDIAIGTSRLFGIDLMKNFNMPYFSRNINEFWKRWHISLTSWFRDYLYIPLGGNRHGKKNTVRNTAVVFLVSGLWHGASLTYVLWGAYHALLSIPFVFIGKDRIKTNVRGIAPHPCFTDTISIGVTFLLVMTGWVIFRAETTADALCYISHMFTHFSPSLYIMGKIPLLWVILLVILEWRHKGKETPLSYSRKGLWTFRYVRWGATIALFFTILFFAGTPQEFIYFRF